MEPRPQTSRPAQDQSPPRRSPSAGGGGDTGSVPQPDPTTIVAPPRADYDYSPLDLAPPGQRRRRQLVAAVLGGLVMLMLLSAAVFAFLLLRDDNDPDDNANSIAVAQTEVAASRATVSAQETIVAAAAGEEAPENTEPGGVATETSTETSGAVSQSTAGDAVGQELGPTPTPPPANDAADLANALSEQQLFALLPAASVMPQGLDSVTEETRTEAEVVDALGGSPDAATRLQNWGWTGNVERVFMASDPAALAPDATTNITVSLHGFSSEQAAAEALTYYSDILVEGGYAEAEAGDIGATNRLLVQPQEGGGTLVALYVQQGSVLYRFGGFSPAGDPTQDVLEVARQVVAP